MDSQQLVCERDGVSTRLRCAECESGICPACAIRTPVGYKCRSCVGESTRQRRRHPAVLLGAGAVVIALLVGVNLLRQPAQTTHDPLANQTSAAGTAATRQAMIGEEARDGQLAFVVEDFSCGPERIPAGVAARSAQGKLCLLRLTVTNISGSPAMFLGRFQYLLDGQSRSYGADEGLTRAVPENANRSLSELNINPSTTVPMALLYDVPETLEPVEAQFKGTGRSRFGVNVRLERRPA